MSSLTFQKMKWIDYPVADAQCVSKILKSSLELKSF